jgi:hypothetical protein
MRFDRRVMKSGATRSITAWRVRRRPLGMDRRFRPCPLVMAAQAAIYAHQQRIRGACVPAFAGMAAS